MLARMLRFQSLPLLVWAATSFAKRRANASVLGPGLPFPIALPSHLVMATTSHPLTTNASVAVFISLACTGRCSTLAPSCVEGQACDHVMLGRGGKDNEAETSV
eukprot:364790-Chlamydomonas_euryale.AAC.12